MYCDSQYNERKKKRVKLRNRGNLCFEHYDIGTGKAEKRIGDMEESLAYI